MKNDNKVRFYIMNRFGKVMTKIGWAHQESPAADTQLKLFASANSAERWCKKNRRRWAEICPS